MGRVTSVNIRCVKVGGSPAPVLERSGRPVTTAPGRRAEAPTWPEVGSRAT